MFQYTAGTVTLGSAIAVRSLTFGTTGYSLTGSNTLTFDSDRGSIDTGSDNQSIAVSGNNLNLNYTGASAVPEPATYALLLGALGFAFVVIRKRRASSS